MDITPPNLPQKPETISTDKVTSLNLKINQQLEAKIIKHDINTLVLTLKISQPSQSILVQSNLAIKTKQGQNLQLLVTKIDPVAEFKVLSSDAEIKHVNRNQTQSPIKSVILDELVLKQLTPTASQVKTLPPTSLIPTILTAKIIAIYEDKIQLKLDSSSNRQTTKASQINQNTSKATDNPSILTNVKSDNTPYIITLNKNELISPQKTINPQRLDSQNYKLGQKIQLINISKENVTPKFKAINATPEKLSTGQIINATVLEIKNNKVQLKLHLNNTSKHNTPSIFSNSTTIILNKNQIINQSLDIKKTVSDKKGLPLDTPDLKQGQLVKFQVIKTGNRPEFELINSKPASDIQEKMAETIKQALPIQESPSELVNQLIKNLSTINKSESIPDNLKRLARNILNSIPRLKSKKISPKQLKQLILNSGLFLETKLSLISEKDDLNLQDDFKNQLLKIHHVLKQELEVKNQQKLQANEVDLIKEMQQKTESSLAKIVLNQLSSLPKEEGIKQGWVIDLPFLNKEFSESVKIEINREQQDNENAKQENWAVTITITPPELGAIHCKVSCFDKTINTRFWSEAEGVVSKITQNLDYLKTQLEKAGMETGHMSAHMRTPTKAVHQNTLNQSLFDQEA
jgi:hypothetical protein